MANSIPLYLKWLVRDPLSGNILIDPLPHLHQSTFKSYISQSGAAGNSVISEFSIPLYGPRTHEYAIAQPAYQQLGITYMQRVEAYFSNTATDIPGVWGDPCFSGLITRLPQNTTDFSIQGYDSLKLAELAATGRMEAFSGRTDQLFTYAMKVYGLVFGDDFTGTLLNNYTNAGSTPTLTTDQKYKAVDLPAATNTYSNTSFNNASYADCAIDADFHVFASTTAGAVTTVAVTAANTGSGVNYIQGSAAILQLTSTSYRVDARIDTVTSGVLTNAASVQGVLSASSNEFNLQLRLIGVQNGSQYTWRLLVGGNDPNCTYTYTATPTGSVGFLTTTTAGSATVRMHGSPGALFGFFNKISIFQPGQIIAGTQNIKQILSLQPPIDLFNLAQSVEQAQFRKNAKAGLNQDTLDFQSPLVGQDLSQQIRFEEGNILDLRVEPNAETITTALIAASSPSPDSGGIHWRHNLAAIRKHGLLYDHAPIHQAVSSLPVRKHADNILINKATPGQAKTLIVLRDVNHAVTAGLPPTNTGLAYREGDIVTLHYPKFGIYELKSQIIGFTFSEGSADMEIVLDQYPPALDRILQIDRLRRTVNHLMSNAEEVTSFSSGVIKDTRVVLAVLPFKFRVHNNANQTLVANTWTLALMQVAGSDNFSYNSSPSFSTATSLFTAPIAGYYDFKARGVFAALGTVRETYVAFGVNGSPSTVANQRTRGTGVYGVAGAAGNFEIVIADEFYLNAGDTVGLYVNSSVADTLSGATQDVWSLFSGHLFSL